MFVCVYVILALILLYLVYEKLIRKPLVRDIHNKYVLITGCDTGFGRQSAKTFDTLGCYVIAGCLKDESVKDLQKQCSSRLLAIKLDVTKEEDVKKAASVVTKHIPNHQGLYAVINNAGILGSVGPMEWMTQKRLQQTIDVNFYGMFYVTNAFLPLLKKCQGSRVVNTASVAGRVAIPYSGSYSLSKILVEGYSDIIRKELRPFGISVHIIEPGGHSATGLVHKKSVTSATNEIWETLTQEMQKEYGRAYTDKLIFVSGDLLPRLYTSTINGVIQAYKHAVFGQYPKLRYTVGADSVGYIIASYLPSWMLDWLFSVRFIEPRPAVLKR